MAKAELQTKQTDASVKDFLGSIVDDQQRADSIEIAKMMERATGEKAKMWGPSIIGFGMTRLKYPSGRELDWMKIGFSPRKAAMTLYILGGIENRNDLLRQLGKYKTGRGCLYIKKLSDVNVPVLKQLIETALDDAKNKGWHN